MKKIALLLATLLVVSACSIPKNPKVSFGKKCMVKDESVSYSYVWLYDKNTGLPASEEQCEALPKKEEK
jgi:hypothetical protein|tara:strand:- start:71 stop:277 length:207 start_codon:yes stop_codon:yes gene_type:complete